MAMQVFANPARLVSYDNAPGHGSYKLDALLGSADVDLTASTSPTAITDPNGVTTGRIARQMYIEVAGNVTFAGSDGTVDVWAVPNNFYMNVFVCYIFKVGTTATGIHALT